jgi:DNA adenine methylase Dam
MEFKKEELIKSPMNYTGGKFKLLSQILPLFPDNIDTFVDLFGGGLNVGINVKANSIIYNDRISYLVSFFKELYTNNNFIEKVYEYIEKYKLSKSNKDGFVQARNDFNKNKDDMILLYTLTCYSFNYQARFNNNFEYNSSFGKDKSHFTPDMENRLSIFKSKMKNIKFMNNDFSIVNNMNLDNNDLVYCDPPYLISTANYNDGKRGFGDWKESDELNLLEYLDHLDKNNVRFALSSVLEHKGKSNDILKKWSSKYIVNFIDKDYSNCSYNSKDKNKNSSIEVLITNY